jgi:hypothetical protein
MLPLLWALLDYLESCGRAKALDVDGPSGRDMTAPGRPARSLPLTLSLTI